MLGYKYKALGPRIVPELPAANTKIAVFLGNTKTKLTKSSNLKI